MTRDPIETAEPDEDLVTCDGGEEGCEERELDALATGWAWWRGQFLCPVCLTALGARAQTGCPLCSFVFWLDRAPVRRLRLRS